MPLPNQGENEGDFMDRCMSDSEMQSKHPEQNERSAVCGAHWREGMRMGRHMPEDEMKKRRGY